VRVLEVEVAAYSTLNLMFQYLSINGRHQHFVASIDARLFLSTHGYIVVSPTDASAHLSALQYLYACVPIKCR